MFKDILLFVFLSLIGETMAQPTKPNSAVDNRLTVANSRFSFKLFDQLAKAETGKNIFVSPASVAFTLAMIYNGASGETQEGMIKTLEWQGMSLSEINQAHAALRALLASADSKVQISIANSLWARDGVVFKPEFIQRNQNFYAAEVANVDFAAVTAPALLNNWVKQKTNGKITQIVERIPSDAVLYLLNAIYFKGNWAAPFDKAQTRDRQFALLNGARKKLPMMSQSGRFRYSENEKFQIISLPYGTGRTCMDIFLPAKDSNLKAFQAELSPANFEKWILQLRSTEGNIVLPRFKLEYEVTLNSTLKTLGMETAFDPQHADFSGMYSKSALANVFIGEIKHKTFVEVNEEGTEAAAVTSGGMRVTSFVPPFNMTVDRPFFCVIRDNQTGTILFMGAIVAP